MSTHHHHEDAARQIEAFRKQKDRFFKERPESPLLPEDKESFHHLDYYPVDDEYRAIATLVPEAHPGTPGGAPTAVQIHAQSDFGRLEATINACRSRWAG